MTDWYAFKGYNNGKAIAASVFDSGELEALGMHFYPTQAEAQAKPNSVTFYQVPVVNAAIDDYNNARDVPGGTSLANNPASPTAAAKSAASAASKAVPIPGVGNVDDLINWLKQGAIWERVGEVAVGLILLYAGIKAIATPAGQNPAKKTFKDTAKHVAKAAAIIPK